jgi:hypothetical protein
LIFRMLVVPKAICFSPWVTCFINDNLFVLYLLYFSNVFLEDSDVIAGCLANIVWRGLCLLKDKFLWWYGGIIYGGYKIAESLCFYRLN